MSSEAHILVVDDEPGMRSMMGFELAERGHLVTEAVDGSEAIGHLERSEFDLVITDYFLPDYPGTDFVRLLRDSDHYKDVPVILLTGRADELDCQRLRDDLFLLVLSKQCGSLQLLVAVFKCLAAVRSATHAPQGNSALTGQPRPV